MRASLSLCGCPFRFFPVETRLRNEKISRSGWQGSTPLAPLQKVVAHNGAADRWAQLCTRLHLLTGGVAATHALLTDTLGGHDFNQVQIAVGTAPAFGPFAADAAEAPTLAELMQVSEQNLVLLRLLYADDFSIVDGEAHATAVDKFIMWLQFY